MAVDIASIIGSAANAITSLFGTLHTNKTNKNIANDTNAANLAAAHETNEYNRQNMLMSNDFNARQTEISRHMSNPAIQRAQLLAAGINSSDAVQYGNVAAPSSVSPPAGVTPNLQGYQFQSPLSSLAGSIQAFPTFMNQAGDYDLKRAQLERMNIENKELLRTSSNRIAAQIAEYEQKKWLNKQDKIRLQMLRQDFANHQNLIDKNNRQLDANFDNTIKNNAMIDQSIAHDAQNMRLEQAMHDAQLHNMSVQETVAFLNAQANLGMSDAAQKNAATNVSNLRVELAKFWDNHRLVNDTTALNKLLHSKTAEEVKGNEVQRLILYQQLKADERRMSAPIRQMINRWFGFDLGSIGGNIGLGGSAMMPIK